MRVDDLAARQQLAHRAGDRDLAGLAARGVDASVERLDRALDRLERQRARHQAGRERVFGGEQACQCQCRRYLGAVQQRQALLGSELERLQAGMRQRLDRRQAAAVDDRLADADQRARQMRQRGQVARRAHRALGRNARRDAVVGQRQQRLDQFRTHARMAARQADRLGRQDQAHRIGGQIAAGTDAVRQHQVALQLGQLVVRDARVRQLAEAGVDAVDDRVGVDDLLHGGLGGAHVGPGGIRHREPDLAAVDAAQFGEGDLAGMQGQRGLRLGRLGSGMWRCHCMVLSIQLGTA